MQEMVAILLEKGVKMDSIDKSGHTPLFFACQKGRKDIVDMLLKAGANKDYEDPNGRTPLFLGASWN